MHIRRKTKEHLTCLGFGEINLDPYSKGPRNGILCTDGDSKKEGFQFKIKKSGTTKIKSNATGDMNCIINYLQPRGDRVHRR